MTIKKKISKKVTKRKVVKKKVLRRSNPNNFAYDMGYKIGITRAEKKQYELYDEYEVYISLIDKLLEKNKFTFDITNYKDFSLGYIRAGIEKYPHKNNIINEHDFELVQNNTNFDNPILYDHSHFLKLISDGYNDIDENSKYNVINNNKNYYYSKFIIQNLLKFKYITKNLYYYILTDKGIKIINNIKRSLDGLSPDNYYLMKDIQDYLSK